MFVQVMLQRITALRAGPPQPTGTETAAPPPSKGKGKKQTAAPILKGAGKTVCHRGY